MKKIYIFLVFITSVSFGQTGPAGIGTGDGSSGPRNVLWLRSDVGVTESGTVSAWADQSGNGLNAVQATSGLRPTYTASNANLNGLPSMSFGPTGSMNYHLAIPDNDLLDDSPEMSFFIVLRTSGTSGVHAFLNKRTGFEANQSYRFYRNSGEFISNIGTSANNSITAASSTNYILSSVYDQSLASANRYNFYSNSTTSNNTSVSATLGNESSPLYIGNFNLSDNRSFPGDLAEIIIYRDALNAAEKVIVENYLSQKYAISIGANDFFSSGDASYANDLVGIGTVDGTTKSSQSGFSDALQIEEVNGSLNAANEFVFIAHDNTAHADNNTSNLGEVEITDRWARSWYLEASSSTSLEFRFDFGTAGLGAVASPTDYVLLYRPDLGSNFTRVFVNGYAVENTDQVVVDVSNISLPSGYYTLGTGTQLVPGDVYSFTSGDWTNPLTWTTDPSGLLRVPVTGLVPTSTDNVTILSGDNVTMDTDDNDGLLLEVNGSLIVGTTTDHDFFDISGNGTISISGNGGVDNFPTGGTAIFADSIVGGTVEILGAGLTLDQDREFNNVVLNLNAAANVATMTADYQINGDLTITRGILQINNTSTTSRTIDAYGDVSIESNGELNVGTGNARHEFNFYGDFINQGRAEFTNRVAADNNNEATDGIIDANFLSDNTDQTIDCFGVTNFYRIEIDKGEDQTYILDVNASSAANFNLFGPVDYSFDAAQLSSNDNALGLIRGTVRLNTNVDVPLLNNTGNYCIFESARLWVNGGSATKTGGAAVVPYGTLQVSDGTFDVPVSSGITTRDNGNIVVEGGVVTVNQIRTSVNGATNIGGYTQSGGTVNVTGSSINTDYYTFSLTYSGNTFNMSGGTLNVSGSVAFADNTGGTSGQIHGGGIFINSDPGNISVTGGTVIMENSTNVNFKVTSNAPFWNVIMRSSAGTATEVDLDGGTSGDDDIGDFETILNPELLVLNDLTVESGVSFDPNGNDIEVGSDLIIEDGAEWDVPLNTDPSAPYTLTLNGVDNSVLRLGNVKALADCGTCTAEWNTDQAFYSLIIDKPDGIRVTLDSSPEKDAVIAGASINSTFNNLVKVVDGTFDLQGGIFDIDIYSIRLETSDVRIDGVLSEYEEGVDQPNANVKLRAATFTIQNSETAEIGNLVFRSNNDIISLANDLNVKRLEFESGLFNLGSNNLKVDYFVNDLRASEADFGGCGGCYSVEDMIVTSGNASDGGISIYVDGNGTYDFPFGVGTTKVSPTSKYTPATSTITNFSDDGYITIRPVDGILGTTDPSGGDILSYYWRVDFEDFTTEPTVQYQFTYDATDDDSGNEAAYVAGKVLDVTPFTRRYEDDNTTGIPGVVQNEGVNTGTNVITFNGDDDTGFTLEAANYTAGEDARFVGAPSVYYTKGRDRTGTQPLWTNANTWTRSDQVGFDPTNPHRSDNPDSPDTPGAGDIVFIGFFPFDDPQVAYRGYPHSARINSGNLEATQLIFVQMEDEFGNAPVERKPISEIGGPNDFQFRPTLTWNSTGSININNMEGEGTIRIRGGSTNNNQRDPSFANVDLGLFAVQDSSYILYEAFNNFTITNVPDLVPNLTITNDGWGANNRDVTITKTFATSQNLEIQGNSNLLLGNGASGDITIGNNLYIRPLENGTGGGELRFPNSGTARNITVGGNIYIGNPSGAASSGGDIIRVVNGGALTHQMSVSGNIVINTSGSNGGNGNGLQFGDGTASVVNLILTGQSNNAFESLSGDVPELHRLVLNKGNSKTNTFTFNNSFTLSGVSNGSTKAIEIQNGTLILNDAAINVDLTTGGDDFSIPSTGGLQITQGTANVSGDDSGIYLDGCLIVAGGTLNMDDAVGNGNNYIEYTASGNSILEISSGVLDVGSQIRPITTANTGVLKYRQTGGDVRIGTQAGPTNNRGMLQVYNTGSEFTYTGGTLAIERHQDSPSIAALYLNPDDSDVTGTIDIFNGNTPTGQTDFGINSTITLADVNINGTNNPTVRLRVNQLTVGGTFTINSGATFNAAGIGLNLEDDFVNDGIFTASSNTTSFTSSTTQSLSGSSNTTFFNFTKSNAGSLDVDASITVDGYFVHNAGTINSSTNTIDLNGNALLEGDHTSAGGEGIKFSGSATQQLSRSTSGTSEVGIITVENSNGVEIPAGNGYNFNINGGLRLNGGVFDIGGSNILFGSSADITQVQPFSVSNMIRTNSSFADKGVGKVFSSGSTIDFTYPLGQTYYTPTVVDFGNSGSADGTLFVSPANEYHPTINDGNDLTASGDINNVLQYYWTLNASGFNNFVSDINFGYNDALVLADDGAESDYIAARILAFNNPSNDINKFTTAEVDETINEITFSFSGDNSNSISGDYFAGIDEAIPDNVATYTVDTNGDYDGDVYDVAVPGGGVPTGSVVIVPNGFTLTINQDNTSFYKTEIQSGGILEIADGTSNHRLGILEGTGDLRIISNGISADLPAFSGNFLSCSGGGLEYAGTGSYSILGGVTAIRNLTLSGAGDRDFPNNNVTICEDLVVDGATVNLSDGNELNINNQFIINSGSIISGTSKITVDDDFILNGGSFDEDNGGFLRIYGDWIIQGGVFNSGSAGSLFAHGDISFSSGSYTTATGAHRVRMVGMSTQSINGNFTAGASFHRLEISNSNGVSLLGGSIEIENLLFLTQGIFDTNDNLFLINASASITPAIGKSTSFINGKVAKTLNSAGNSFTFPIGSSTLWRPASVNNVSTGGLTWEAEYFQADPTSDPLVDNLTPTNPGQILAMASGEYWKISDGNVAPSGVTATVGLSWGIESDVSSVSAEREQMEVMVWNDGISSWDNLGGNFSASAHSQTAGRFLAVSSASFSEKIFTLGSSDLANPLPITLTLFTGQIVDNAVKINWETSSEINNDYFELQRSSNGIDYETIAEIAGNGTSLALNKYQYVDKNPLIGRNYYQLKQVDFDGKFEIPNNKVVIDFVPEFANLNFTPFPNPTDEFNINIRLEAVPGSPVEILMYDMFGKMVYSNILEANSYQEDVIIKPETLVRNGIYLVTIEQLGRKVSKRVVIKD